MNKSKNIVLERGINRKQYELVKKMDEYDVCRLKYEQCQYCKYFLIQNTKAIGMGTCDYIGKTGHMRGCTPLQCKEKGIFVKAKGKKNGKRKEKCLED